MFNTRFTSSWGSCTYVLAASAGSTAGTTATAATTGRLTAASALALAVGTLDLVLAGLRLAGLLNRDLALEDLLAGKLSDGTLCLGGGGEVDEGIADGTVGAGVLGDRDGLAVTTKLAENVIRAVKHGATLVSPPARVERKRTQNSAQCQRKPKKSSADAFNTTLKRTNGPSKAVERNWEGTRQRGARTAAVPEMLQTTSRQDGGEKRCRDLQT